MLYVGADRCGHGGNAIALPYSIFPNTHCVGNAHYSSKATLGATYTQRSAKLRCVTTSGAWRLNLSCTEHRKCSQV